ncbi:MAG: glycoside hydrolase family 3 C-terminal domain-containing protein [Candidatus Onthomonas sp.]
MKHSLKRLSLLVLSLALVMATLLPAWAADTAEAPDDAAPEVTAIAEIPEEEAAPEEAAPEEDEAPDGGGAPEGMEGMEMPEGFQMPSMEAAGWQEDTQETKDTAEAFQIAAIAVVVVVGLLALVTVVILVRNICKKKQPSANRKALFNTLVALGMAAVLVFQCVGNSLAFGTYKNSIDALFTKSARTDSGIDTAYEDWVGLAYEIANQGMVLMRNEDSTLPLDTSAGKVKINLLGYRAYNPIYTGSGSGSVNAENAIDIVTTLENAGFEVNTACVEQGVYEQKETESKGIGFMGATFAIDEVSLDKYTGSASFEAMKEYSDIAVVVIGRTGGEGSDLTAFEGEEGKTYLQLSSQEEALLQKARETFGTLIVVYNGANAMEMGYLETYDVDACIWAGIPGPNGFNALGKIMSGEVNPSGKLPDTWVYDLNSNPVSENYADQAADNTNGYYVDYVEGIYVGYKFYETAYAEKAVLTNTDTGVTYDYSDYESIVQFPFGFGLSYTTFQHEIVGGLKDGDVLSPDGSITVQVKVTNTGSVTGKDAVELYLTAPYTDYDKTNKVEKAEVALVGYAKTGDIAPGASETVEITIPVEDIASYDSSHDNGDGTRGCYMLDAGDYVFSIRSDSHNVYDSVTVLVENQHFYCGEDQRESDDQAAYNQFDDAARGIYLSRQDGFANYEEAMASVSSSVKDPSFDQDPSAYDPAYDSIVTKEYVKGVDYEADGNLTLSDMKGLAYEDSKWDELIKQLSIDEIKTLITETMYATAAVESVDKHKTTDTDGPLGISSMFNAGQSSVAYPCLPLLAATFNDDLARAYGNYIADQAHSLGISGWYAPAMNIHRWAFSGRNFEYYSEDATLSAGIGSNETLGAREKGLVVYLKHFALNDMESHRSGRLHTYSNEQAIREIYLKPFEKSVKYGGATAIMSSMNYIGDVYSSACEALCTQVLRNEWGFRGMILTDVAEDAYATDCADAAIRAGTDFWLAMGEFSISSESNADIYYLQRVAHDILYAEANAQVIKAEVIQWQNYLYALDVELGILFVVGAIALIRKNRKPKAAKNG